MFPSQAVKWPEVTFLGHLWSHHMLHLMGPLKKEKLQFPFFKWLGWQRWSMLPSGSQASKSWKQSNLPSSIIVTTMTQPFHYLQSTISPTINIIPRTYIILSQHQEFWRETPVSASSQTTDKITLCRNNSICRSQLHRWFISLNVKVVDHTSYICHDGIGDDLIEIFRLILIQQAVSD